MSRSYISLLVICVFVPAMFAQAPSTAVCDFDSNAQLAVQYQPTSVNISKPVFGHEIPYHKVWAPGGKPMTMFLNHEVMLDGKDIPVGAYTMFVIPAPNKWTLIVSRNTDTSGKYDENKDLVRAPMQWGELSSPESVFSIYFAQTAPGQCTMRVDLEKSRAWVDFKKKQ
jgi:hypothetical protein